MDFDAAQLGVEVALQVGLKVDEREEVAPGQFSQQR